jgi:leucyl aminopeptidase (aminopeptidase T)
MQFRTSSRLLLAALAVALAACGGANAPPPEQAPQAKPAPAATAPAAPAVDLQAVAKTMVEAAMIKTDERVLIQGSVRDNELLEDLAIETMKAGGQPLISVTSDRLARQSYDAVPASYDTRPQTLALGLVNLFDADLEIESGELENVLAGVPAARIAARAKAGLPVEQAFLKKSVRLVHLGNGLYPTAALAARMGKPQAEVAAMFWKAALVSPDVIRAKGEALRSAVAAARQLTISSANGTKLTVGVVTAKGFISDGAISADKVKQGQAATETWRPAGELLLPAAPGTAEGTVVIDKLTYQGTTIEGLTLAFSKGQLTSMTARSGLDALKALYDASGSGKDQFGFVDLGLNPEATFPTNTGRVVWVAPGAVTVGLGDNTGWGGTNASDFVLSCPVSGATLSADGKVLIENGALK